MPPDFRPIGSALAKLFVTQEMAWILIQSKPAELLRAFPSCQLVLRSRRWQRMPVRSLRCSQGAPRVSAAEVRLLDVAADSRRVRATVLCDGPCLLVVARPWDPGWRARVDGDPADVERANLAGLGVVSPAGEHVVELVYRPWSLR